MTLLQIVRRVRRLVAIALPVALAVLGATPARAFKWTSCPVAPSTVYPSVLGATTSPFIHPGHDLTIVLNAAEVASTGGFSVAPTGNVVTVVFRSLFGASVALPARRALASSPNVLSFTFPDGVAESGRELSGPVEVTVQAGRSVVASIRATDLVALPAANDVTALVLGESPDQIVWAGLGADGDIWVPAGFRGDPMEMPGCPGDFIWPLPVVIAGATVPGAEVRGIEPISQIRGVWGYLGDINIGGINFYGMLYPETIRLTHIAGTLGVSITRMNDVIDMVLRVRGDASWANPSTSPFRNVAAASAPLPLQLVGLKPLPNAGPSTSVQSPLRTK